MKSLLLLLTCSLFCQTYTFSAEGEETDRKTEKKVEKPKPVSTGDKIYTWIDESGNRIYSDVPREGAEVMEISTGTDYTPPESVETDWNNMKPKVISTGDIYSHFEIVSPVNDATIRNNEGAFQVALDIRPTLIKGHHIKLEIDGVKVSGSGQIFTLENIDRGSHTLVATILSADGTVMATTQAITIHLHRARRGGS